MLAEQQASAAPPTFIPLALPPPVTTAADVPAGSGLIEIELSGGHRVRAAAGADLTLLQGAYRRAVWVDDPVPSGSRVWLATGHTDMRKGFDGLAALVQDHLARDPFSGQAFVFRGRQGHLIKVLWWGRPGAVPVRQAPGEGPLRPGRPPPVPLPR